jgi:hypothetical protein
MSDRYRRMSDIELANETQARLRKVKTLLIEIRNALKAAGE